MISIAIDEFMVSYDELEAFSHHLDFNDLYICTYVLRELSENDFEPTWIPYDKIVLDMDILFATVNLDNDKKKLQRMLNSKSLSQAIIRKKTTENFRTKVYFDLSDFMFCEVIKNVKYNNQN